MNIINLKFLLSLYDNDTYNHAYRVAYYSNLIGKELNLPINEMNLLFYSALLHDIGKIFFSPDFLYKKEKLTNDEYKLIKMHVNLGMMILPDDMKDIKQIIFAHHEKLDGSGYPNHIEGRHIPKLSKIIAIADSYDAMTSNRYYNKVKSANTAMLDLMHHTNYYGENWYSYTYVKSFINGMKKINTPGIYLSTKCI